MSIRIIRRGIKRGKYLRFSCDECGTIFDASKDDEEVTPITQYNETEWGCACPVCGETVYSRNTIIVERQEVKEDREQTNTE